MSFKYTDVTDEIRSGLDIIGAGFELDGEVEVTLTRCESGFRAEVCNGACKVSYNKPNDLYRAMSFVYDAVRGGYDISLSESPAFELCGIMLDASRGAVPKTETVKALMVKMARMGLNELMLYTEDTYEIDGYPYFGYMRGRYSKEELKEIVSYGNALGIETIPCIQTLGHLAKPLRWSAFSDVAQSPDILFIGEEDTYKLIEAMIKASRECFTSNKIHIGMDEAHSVGLGKYLEKHGMRDRFTILCEHLARVKEITDRYGFEPFMWSDMFFRLASKTGDYYDIDAVLPSDLPEKLPSGVTQVYWDYYNRSEKLYDVLIEGHSKMGCPLAFAGGIWTWGVPSVNYHQSFAATRPALEISKRYGIKNAFACLWGDDGAECDIHEALLGLQLYAEMNYRTEVSDAALAESFRICTGADAEMFLGFDTDGAFDEISELEHYSSAATENQISTVTKQALYQNPMMGLFDKNHESLPLKQRYTEMYERFSKFTPSDEWRELYDSHLQLLRVLVDKCDIGNRLKSAYDAADRTALAELKCVLERLVYEIDKYKLLRDRLWFKYNKMFGFENLSARISHLSDMCRIGARRLGEYLRGELDSLEELEAERLPYNPKGGALVHSYFAGRMMIV